MLFFFDTDDGERSIVDSSGTDIPDGVEVVEQAVSLLRDLSHIRFTAGVPRSFAVRVRSASGEDLYAASLQLKVDRLD